MDRLTVGWANRVYDTLDPVDVVDNEYSKANYNKILTKLGECECDECPYPLSMIRCGDAER